jgi:hypothetical protein
MKSSGTRSRHGLGLALAIVTLLCGCLVADGGGRHSGPGRGGGYDNDYDPPDYGDPRPGRDEQVLVCESRQGRRRRCAADGLIRRVEIERVLSDTPCAYRDTWGYDERDVWVDAGCRARFRVEVRRGGRPGGGYDDADRRERVLDCASHDGRQRVCDVGFRIADARVVKRHSGSPCERGNSWGWQGRDLWVDQGCRARFRVYGR